MSCLGVLFSIDGSEAEKLKKMEREDIVEYIQEEIEEVYFNEKHDLSESPFLPKPFYWSNLQQEMSRMYGRREVRAAGKQVMPYIDCHCSYTSRKYSAACH